VLLGIYFIFIFFSFNVTILSLLPGANERDKRPTETDMRVRRETSAGNGRVNVAAFNVEIFGVTKYGIEDVVTVLSQVRYTVIVARWRQRKTYLM